MFGRQIRRLVTALPILALAQCAYRIQRQELRFSKSDPEGRLYELAIPVFDNFTARASPSESIITNAFRDRWARIANVRLVDTSKAEFVILGRVKKWSIDGGRNLFTGTPTTEAYGGLTELQSSVAALEMELELDIEILRNIDGAQVVELRRSFKGSKAFEAYNRFDEASGSSSAPMVHDSRERIILKSLAESLANDSINIFKENF